MIEINDSGKETLSMSAESIPFTLILWIFSSVTEIFRFYFILKISRNDSYYVKSEVHFMTYVVNIIVTTVAFFSGLSFVTTGIIELLIIIASLGLAINDSINNKIWTILTITIFEMTLNSIALSILRYFWNLEDVINDVLVPVFILPLLAIIYHIKYHTSLLDNLLNKNGVNLIKVILLLSAFFQCQGAAVIYTLNDKNLLITIFSFLCVLLLCSLTWYIINVHNKLIELSTEQEELLTNQKEYYLTLLDKEEETRRYRHDMNNHLMCLSALLDKNNTDDLREYLSNLQDEFKSVNDTVYQTGNTILTAITAHYIPMVDENTKVNITGRITKDFGLNNTELCSVYSNLLKNSLEELQRIDESVNKELNIRFDNGKNFGKIFISNSMKDPSSFRGLASKTAKDDKKNHGFGIQNINRIVSKHNGTFTIRKDNDQFCCEVVLPVLSAMAV